MIKKVHPEVVLCMILKSFMLISRKNFNICIVNNSRFYAINKNKVSIVIWPLTVYLKLILHKKGVNCYQYLQNKISNFVSRVIKRIVGVEKAWSNLQYFRVTCLKARWSLVHLAKKRQVKVCNIEQEMKKE